jgi:hypothetical protein
MNQELLHTKDALSTRRGELSRLMIAAVVNKKFCDLLLTNPKLALAAGCNGEVFHLAPEEYHLILSIQATSLADLATQLTKKARNGNGNGHNHNGNGHNILAKLEVV